MDKATDKSAREEQATLDREEKSRARVMQHLAESMRSDADSVLVVDDSVAIRRFVTNLIRDASPTVNVVEAINGQDALDRITEIREQTQRDPIFIITDLDMPVMDGWSLVDKLAKLYRPKGEGEGVPVIVLSGTTGEKGLLLGRKSISKSKRVYSPLVAVAKASCLDPKNYDSVGKKSLMAWIEYFLNEYK